MPWSLNWLLGKVVNDTCQALIGNEESWRPTIADYTSSYHLRLIKDRLVIQQGKFIFPSGNDLFERFKVRINNKIRK